jgi:hypothetical protein
MFKSKSWGKPLGIVIPFTLALNSTNIVNHLKIMKNLSNLEDLHQISGLLLKNTSLLCP